MNETILFFAFRYALGRKTYAVQIVVDEIIKNKELLSEQTKRKIVEEINDCDDLGNDCDKKEWDRCLTNIK